MQAADEACDAGFAGQALSVSQDVDRTRMRTAGDDDQPSVAHVDDKRLIVPDHRIGLPTVRATCLVDGKATLELGHALDLPRDQDTTIEQQAVRALLDYFQPLGLQVVATRRRQAQLAARWKHDPALTPRVRVDHQRQSRAPPPTD